MQRIVDELVNDERPVITNLPVRVEPWVRCWTRFGKKYFQPEIGLRNYLLKTYGHDCNVSNRVFYIGDEKVPEFFLYRRNGVGLIQADATRRKAKDGELVIDEFDTAPAVKNGGVVYVTDEAWKFWNARSWQRTGEGLLFYSAQHRHLGDTWFIVTQKTGQVDKALHRVAQDFSVVTNHSKVPLGMFRRPDMFTISVYDQPPTGAQLEPVQRKAFHLDRKGLGACYDTAARTGIGGGSAADLHERKKGLPWWGLLVLVFGVGFSVWAGVHLLGRGVGYEMKRINKTAPRSTQPSQSPQVEPSHARSSNENVQTNGVDVVKAPEIEVTSRVQMPDYWMIGFSDGRTIKSRQVLILSDYVMMIDGRPYKIRQHDTTVTLPPKASQFGVDPRENEKVYPWPALERKFAPWTGEIRRSQ